MNQTSTATFVYLILSKDDYDIDHFLSFLKKKAGFEQGGLIQEIYHRDETDLSLVLDSALNLPMFASKKLIVVKYSSELLLSDVSFLMEYLNHPSPQTILVITAREVSKKSKLAKTFQNSFRKVTFPNVPMTGARGILVLFPGKTKREEKIHSWIHQQCSERGLQMDNKALDFFYEICGKDKLVMLSEIEKLASFKENIKRVTIEDIKEIASENKVLDVYALLEYICQRDRAKAIEALRNLLESRKSHPFIIWHLENSFSKLAIVKTALQSGDDDQTALKKAGIRFYKNEFIQNARTVREKVIMKAPAHILQADRLMKSGLPEEIILEKLIFDLT